MKQRTYPQSRFQLRAPLAQRPRKSLVDRLFGFIDSLKPPKTPAEKVQGQLTIARAAFQMELAAMLASALAAKKTLDGTRQVDIPFPERYLNGTATIDDAARAELAAYAAALEAFRGDLADADTPLTQTVARGVDIWIATMHSLAVPGLEPLGKEIWSKLETAAENLDEAHRHLLRRAPTEIELGYFKYRPAALTKK